MELRARFNTGALLSDGGMGTSLVELGVPLDSCFELANVERADLVERVHRGFVEAGAEMVLTNTFGANRFALGRRGLADRVTELNREAVARARAAGSVLVAGSVGPLRVRLAPYGRVRPSEAFDAYLEQVAALIAAGVDLLIVETQSDIREIEQALAAARAVSDAAVVVTVTFARDDRTLLGEPPEEVSARLVELGADAIGVNCGQALLSEGVALIGGCCGTGPAHIRAIGEAVAGPAAPHVDLIHELPPDLRTEDAVPATDLSARLSEGRFVVAVEVEPPRGHSVARMLAAAETLGEAGADVIDVADSPLARLRMSPWAACRLIQEEAKIETVLHFPTRGRNLLRLQGDLLAVHALGIRNLFVCLGDPVAIGDYPGGTDNVDVAPTGLIRVITGSFNQGRDQLGSSIGEPTGFFVGCAVNPNSPDLDRECRLLKRKLEAGASFALSQPVYQAATLARLRDAYAARYGPLDVPILAGVLPLMNGRHAEYLHNEVPGISIPEDVRERMRRAGERGEREGVRLAVDISLGAAGLARGVYLMPQFGRFDLTAEIVEEIRGALGQG